MSARALVLGQDDEVLSVLQSVLAENGTAATVCTAVSTAQAKLATSTFNPVVVDCEGMDGGTEFLEGIRHSGPNFESVVLAVVKSLEGMRSAFAAGATLVLWKPVRAEEAARVVRTTQGLFNRRRRRFPRRIVPVLTYVHIEGVPHSAMLTELGEGGMGVQTIEPLEARQKVQVRFLLPGSVSELEAAAEIAWADATGRAGLRFTALTLGVQSEIKDWICGRTSTADGAVLFAIRPREEPDPSVSTAQQAFAALLDAVLVGGATALFGFMYYLVTRHLPSESATPLATSVTFLVLWLAYRFVFFRDPSPTPGRVAAARLCNLYLNAGGDRLDMLTPSN